MTLTGLTASKELDKLFSKHRDIEQRIEDKRDALLARTQDHDSIGVSEGNLRAAVGSPGTLSFHEQFHEAVASTQEYMNKLDHILQNVDNVPTVEEQLETLEVSVFIDLC